MNATRVPKDFPVQPLDPKSHTTVLTAKSPRQCLVCFLWWDDGAHTEYTPAPSGRCPFEAFHDLEEQRLVDRKAFIDSLGLVYTATFVPQSRSRNAKEKDKTLNWRISLTRGNRTFECDYTQGIGRIPNYPHHKVLRIAQAEYDATAETGRYPILKRKGAGWLDIERSIYVPRKALPAPDLHDVLYSLCLDSDAIQYTFEQWCDSLDFDTDSRKAERLYKACLDTAIRLAQLLSGAANLATLTELFQDY